MPIAAYRHQIAIGVKNNEGRSGVKQTPPGPHNFNSDIDTDREAACWFGDF